MNFGVVGAGVGGLLDGREDGGRVDPNDTELGRDPLQLPLHSLPSSLLWVIDGVGDEDLHGGQDLGDHVRVGGRGTRS